MRIAIISPYSIGPMRGNITTVRRIAHQLTNSGVETLILAADAMSPKEMLDSLRSFAPDIIHAFHAHHCGPVACVMAAEIGKPCVITITGSDIHEPEFCQAPATKDAINAAKAIICFEKKSAEAVASSFPGTSAKLAVIPQGVESLPANSCASFNIPDDAFVLLLPAALRPVKQIEFAINATARMAGQIDNLLLVIAGGAIDTKYSADIRQLLRTVPQAVWLGDVPYEQMGCLYNRADIVLNCSVYEEMPNSLLEAMALGRTVLATDIAGNSSLVTHGHTGWLYSGVTDFINKILQLSKSFELRQELGRHARQFILSNFTPELEADRYITLYRSTVQS